jgi:pimeloyl-ACP methyl ester carboxylesterase
MEPTRDIDPGSQRARVVFLHGYPGRGADFTEIGKEIDADCEAFDMPWLDPDLGALSVAAIVAALVSALPPYPVHLVGHDLGAVIAWQLAHTHPTRVRSLSLISVPRLDRYVKALPRLHDEGYLRYREVLMVHDPRSALPNLETLTLDEASNEGLMLALAERRAQTNPSALLSLYRDLSFLSPKGRADIGVPPMLLLHGDQDPYFPKSLLAEAKSSKGDDVTVCTFKGGGHWLHLLDASATAQALKTFIEAQND